MMTGRKVRPMTAWEYAVLGRLLELPFEGRDELMRQGQHALARAIAGPGDHDGSIEFRVAGDLAAPVRWSVPVEACGRDADGIEIDILLHVKDGMLDTLEVVKADGSPVISLPDADSLKVALLTYGVR